MGKVPNETIVFFDHYDDSIEVGTLYEKQRSIYFEYSKSFLDSAYDISPLRLPKSNETFKDLTASSLYRLPGVFYDSLPDGWGNYLMDLAFRKKGTDPSTLSPLTRLQYVGENGIGALRYMPSKKMSHDIPVSIIAAAEQSERLLAGDTNEVLNELLVSGGPANGARPKVFLAFHHTQPKAMSSIETEKPDGFSDYIVKFRGYQL